MLAFALRRLLWSIPVIFVVVTAIFFLMRSIGGDPFRHGPLVGLTAQGQGRWVKYGDWQPPAIRRAQQHKYGLDLPWYEQYANFLEGVATFDYGPSLSFRDRSVNEILEEHAPRSLELGLLAFVWAFGLGIPLGVLAAFRQGTALDAAIRLFSSAGLALPTFLVGTVLVYFLSVRLGVFPTHGWTRAGGRRCCLRSPSGSCRSPSARDSPAAPPWRRCRRSTSSPRAPRDCVGAGVWGGTCSGTRSSPW